MILLLCVVVLSLAIERVQAFGDVSFLDIKALESNSKKGNASSSVDNDNGLVSLTGAYLLIFDSGHLMPICTPARLTAQFEHNSNYYEVVSAVPCDFRMMGSLTDINDAWLCMFTKSGQQLLYPTYQRSDGFYVVYSCENPTVVKRLTYEEFSKEYLSGLKDSFQAYVLIQKRNSRPLIAEVQIVKNETAYFAEMKHDVATINQGDDITIFIRSQNGTTRFSCFYEGQMIKIGHCVTNSE